MKINKSETFFKTIWFVCLLITIYTFGWLTFLFYTFGNIGEEKFTFGNLIIPNIFTIAILIIYTKELLIGYSPKSKVKNKKSLFLALLLIVGLTITQIPLFEFLLDANELEYWQIIVTLIIILTSYSGLIMNRILKIKELKTNKWESNKST